MINIDFHLHTNKSFDGYNSYNQILKQCILKNIHAVAFTDHDVIKIPQKAYRLFEKHNINIIPGCEFTTDKGAHIIGLFIEYNKLNLSLDEVVDLVEKQNGLLYIPHPFKKVSGVFDVYPRNSDSIQKLLLKSSFIELYNGGWDSGKYGSEIKKISKKYDLRLVAGSDAHKPWQIGYYLNAYNQEDNKDIRALILQESPKLLKIKTGKTVVKRSDEKKYFVGLRNSTLIKGVKKMVPFKLRQSFKKIFTYPKIYFKSLNKTHSKVKYTQLND
ncbi:PHP domain-containing protein [Rhodohalobacter halophilus]|uniref:PHP domain-containing protein n=1 Tax=Rhodohalobacter halophilus TaxID=1812810 RepID=UPI00083FC2B5|nr:PHP domain-containing protein [Rhodohalobacter halophilus]